MQLFRCCFDVKDAILPSVLNFTSRNSGADVVIKVLGQEQNGDILFSYYDVDAVRNYSLCTHIGVYSPNNGSVQLLYEAGKGVVDIVAISVTACRSLLAYTRCVTCSGKEDLPSGRYELYFVSLAKEKPSEKRFRSDYETFLSAQFLPCTSCDTKHHALVLTHKEGIKLYEFAGTFPTPHNGKQLVGNHIWYQWDPATMAMYVLHAAPLPGKKSLQNCIKYLQITADSKYVEVFDVPVNIRLNSRKLSRYRHEYRQSTVPDKDINLTVVSQPSGAIAFCWQILRDDDSTKGSDDVNATGLIDYCVQTPVHYKVINVKVSHALNSNRLERRVCFIPHKDYILAYVPGCFIHLIDVNIDSDATHHVIYQSSVTHSELGVSGQLSYFNTSSAVGFYDSLEGRAYNIAMSSDYVFDTFGQCYSAYTRLAMVRYLTLYANDTRQVLQFMSMIKEDIGSPETNGLIMEYIVSSAHASFCTTVRDSAACSLLPYSADEDFSLSRADHHWSQPVKSCSGDSAPALIQSQIIPDPFQSVSTAHTRNSKETAEAKARKDKLSQHWRYYATRCKARPPPGSRLRVRDAFLKVTGDLPLDESQRRWNGILSNLICLLGSRTSAGNREKADQSEAAVAAAADTYMKAIQDKVQALYSAIYETLPLEESEAIQERHDSTASSPRPRGLSLRSSVHSSDRVVFQMLERLYYSIINLGLALPNGFAATFGQLGYLILTARLFLQYLDEGVITITDQLMKLFVSEHARAKTPSQRTFLLQCISRLQQEDAIAACWTVKSGYARQFAAEEAVAYCYHPMTAENATSNRGDESLLAAGEQLSHDEDEDKVRERADLLTRTPSLSRLMGKLSASGVSTLKDEIRFENAAFYFTKNFERQTPQHCAN